MSKTLTLTNSKDIICNSISLIQGTSVVDLTNLFLLKNSAVQDLIGIAPEDLNTISELAASLNNDSNFFTTVQHLLALQASLIYVDRELCFKKRANLSDILNTNQINYLMALKSDKLITYTIEDINRFFKKNKTQIN